MLNRYIIAQIIGVLIAVLITVVLCCSYSMSRVEVFLTGAFFGLLCTTISTLIIGDS